MLFPRPPPPPLPCRCCGGKAEKLKLNICLNVSHLLVSCCVSSYASAFPQNEKRKKFFASLIFHHAVQCTTNMSLIFQLPERFALYALECVLVLFVGGIDFWVFDQPANFRYFHQISIQ